MRIDVYHHYDVDARLDRIELLLIELKQQGVRMSKDEAKRLDTLTNAIKARFDKLIASLPSPLSPEEQAEVDADLATLEAIGHDPDNPIPTP